MTDAPKPPGPAGTREPGHLVHKLRVHFVRANGERDTRDFEGPYFDPRVLGKDTIIRRIEAYVMDAGEVADIPVTMGFAEPAAPADSAPFVASRPELGETARRDREFARLRSEEAERERVATAAGLPGPWRWEDGSIGHAGRFPAGVLRAANGAYILDRGDGDGQDRPPPDLPPRVRALTEAAPGLRDSLEWALAIIDAYGQDEGYWPRSSGDPEGRMKSARELLDRIDRAGTS